MAKIAKKLTDTEIKSTKPAEKEVNLFDGDGLLLRIAPLAKGGKKNWYFRYAVPVTKKRTKVSLGTYPHLTLAKARALRDEYLSLLTNGIENAQFAARTPAVEAMIFMDYLKLF